MYPLLDKFNFSPKADEASSENGFFFVRQNRISLGRHISPIALSVIGLLVLMAIGFWIRWRLMQVEVFQIDEFISMLAIRMILKKGTPTLPSGLYYDHGLVFSYLGALFAWLGQGDLLAARWWSLIAGVLSIGTAYFVSWRLFQAPGWSLFAAAGFVFYSEAIQWSTRVRMYSQANLILLLWILLLWLGTLGGGRRWARIGLIIAIWVGAYTHSALLLVLPPLILAIIIVWLIKRKRGARWPTLHRLDLLEGSLAIIAIGLTIWGVAHGFVANYTVDSSVPTLETAAVNTRPFGQVINLTLNVERWHELKAYLLNKPLLPFSVLTFLGLLILGDRLTHADHKRQDFAALFLALVLIGTLLEFLFLVTDDWQEERYHYLLIFPLLVLLATYGVQATFQFGSQRLQRLLSNNGRLGILIMLSLYLFSGIAWGRAVLWDKLMYTLAGKTDTPNRYNVAFEYVNTMRLAEDTVMTVQPAAGYLFAEEIDYYVNYRSPVVIPGENGWVDGYTGTPYLHSSNELKYLLDKPGHLWVVLDEKRLFGYLEPVFTQHLLWHTEVEQQIGNVFILRETDKAVLPITPDHSILARWANNIRLVGYSTDRAVSQDEAITITTFWQDSRPMWVYKMFVHLRDSQGGTIAQADFTPLEKIHPKLRDRMISQAGPEIIPLTTTLYITPDIMSGTYHLYLGLYNGTTLERVPLLEDASGENAIVLGDLDF